MNGSTPALADDYPANDELEITLFGSGYGESIVIHTSDSKWLIVDSTVHRDTRKPAALQYLESMGVDVSRQVVGVVVTHWHDDHIKGISQIAEKCLAAKFYISAALMCAQNRKKFTKLVLDSPLSRLANLNADSNSGVNEFRKLLKTLKSKDNPPEYALHDKLLIDKPPFQLWALAPHSSIYEKAIEAIIAQIPDKVGCVQRLRAPKPNYTSVVLWLKFGTIRVLLGADLEENSEHKGWRLIISGRKASIIDQKAEVFKVAHHGSITGHHDEIWTELLAENPLCLIAPFNKNPKLPTTDDISRISGRSSNVYITSLPMKKVECKIFEDKHVRRKLSQRQVTYVNEAYSYVRARKKPNSNWRIDTYGDACHLSPISNVA